MGKLFRWLLMGGGGSRWAQIKAWIGDAFRANANIAPTADATVRSTSGNGVAADPIKVPIADGKAQPGQLLGLLARGDTRRIVLARIRAGLCGAFRATAAAIPVAVAAIREVWGTAFRAAGESVPTIDGGTVPAAQGTAHRADPDAVETVLPSASGDTGMAMSAEPGTAAAAEVAASGLIGTGMYAKPGTWFEPVVVDGVLVINQAYNAAVVDGVLEVE